MLSSLGRNGFVESSLGVARYGPRGATMLVQCRFRHTGCVAPASSARLAWRGPTPFSAYSPPARLLSSGATKTDDPTRSPPPAPAPAQRKHKVELRPAPLKPAPVKPANAPSETAPVPPKPAAAASATPAPTSAPAKPGSLIGATQHDLDDASQHGILAPPPEGASWVGRLWHQAKELFKFYWRGIKLVWYNRKRAQAIEARVQAGGAPLSRWEARFIRTNKTDQAKLVPFLLIIIIIEEILPLVVLYAPFLLPSTCLLPSQKDRINSKRREKQKQYWLSNRVEFEQLRERLLANPGAPVKGLLDSTSLVALNGILALSTLGPNALRMHRLQQYLATIAEDDALLKRESSGETLSQAELQDALEERGIVTDGLTPKQWQSRLQWWLTKVDEQSPALSPDPVARRMLLVASMAANKMA